MGSWLSDLLGGSAAEIINSVTDGVDKFVTTDAEKQELELKKKEAELAFKRLELEVEQKLIEDRAGAREMYQKDSSLQKVFAIVFLVGYLAITGLMLYMVFTWVGEAKLEIPAWGVSLISSLFTAMSTKVNTIVDFLFGGSESKDNSERIMAQTLNNLPK
jgi:hypothetical protein